MKSAIKGKRGKRIVVGIIAGFIFFFLFGLLYVVLNFKSLIYPPLHRYQLSPRQYVKEKGNLLPQAASISLIVEEHGGRDKPQVALTFDADMTPGMILMLRSGIAKSWYNRDIKTILDQTRTKATVFLGGLWVQTYPLEAKELAIDPLIEIGNHSYNHYAFANSCYSLPTLPDDQDEDDVLKAQHIIKAITGITPKYFRFPGGCYDRVALQSVADLGLTIVHWDVVAMDGFNENTDSIVRAVESQVQNGSIIVMHIHDGSYAPKTAEALKRIIPDLRKQGFEFVKVSEILK